MNKEKYYTPLIEEFHKSFEFEFSGVDCNWNKQPFTKHYIGEDYFGLYTLSWVERLYKDDDYKEYIRVKYLDREDIESLGFKKDSGDHDFIKDEYQLEILSSKEIYITTNYGEVTLFKGFVKNKSELKKILQQLNII